MDLCLQIIHTPRRDAGSELADVYQRGDIVALYPNAEALELHVPNGRMAFLRLIPGPSIANARRARLAITEEWRATDEAQLMLRRRTWRVDIDALPVRVRRALADKRDATMTWRDVVGAIISGKTGQPIKIGDIR